MKKIINIITKDNNIVKKNIKKISTISRIQAVV